MNAPYKMTLDLNVLRHLGFNLYSNTAAVLSEVVANAWDADAEHVWVDISSDKIVIRDDGSGMTRDQVNDRYLTVGFERRKHMPTLTPIHGRRPMGRKGIGKLSLFSIADQILVETAVGGSRDALLMDRHEIETAISVRNSAYEPTPQTTDTITFDRGTRLTLTGLRKKTHLTPKALRRRLARRFSVIGAEKSFNIVLDGKPISVADRDYFHKVQYIWVFGDEAYRARILAECNNLEHHVSGDGVLEDGNKIKGWIATAKSTEDLRDDDGASLNMLTVTMRGKVADEDILPSFGEGGVYGRYVFGEIEADFLDDDTLEDIATSSRQSIVEDDERFRALLKFARNALRAIKNEWTTLRNKKGTEEASELPAIKAWLATLKGDDQVSAKAFLGHIAGLVHDVDERRHMYAQGVVSFEVLRHRRELNLLKDIASEDGGKFRQLLRTVDEYEATLYHQIITERVGVIRTLEEKVSVNVKEHVIRDYLSDYPWLLDPTWERSAVKVQTEKAFKTLLLDEADKLLTKEEQDARLDVLVIPSSGQWAVIELKRPEVKIRSAELYTQVQKYWRATKKVLKQKKIEVPAEFVVVLGALPIDWEDEELRVMEEQNLSKLNARVTTFDELLETALGRYADFLEANREANRLSSLLSEISPETFGIDKV